MKLMFDHSDRRPTFYEREKGFGTTLINMDSEGSLRATGQGHEAIATFGLCGCTAVAVVLENPDNSAEHVGIIAHYSPLAINARLYNRLRTLLQQHGASGWKATAYIVTPGQWSKSDEGKYSMLPKDDLVTSLLTSVLHADLPGLHEVSVRGYSEMLQMGATEQGTVVIRFNPDGARVFIEGMPA
jgi:hypothetical protein